MKIFERNRNKKEGLYDPRNEHDSCGLGFIANIKGRKSHDIIQKGLFILENLEHRGATGADPLVGDGAGMLTQIPHEMYKEEMEKLKVFLPDPGKYGVGMFFFPRENKYHTLIKDVIIKLGEKQSIELLGWRDIPVNNECLSKDNEIREAEPIHLQGFFKKPEGMNEDDFERNLYILRKKTTNRIFKELSSEELYYAVSLSSRTVVYKGMFLADQLAKYYLDLQDVRYVSALSLVHQRFSTNTFPSWRLAHPYRMVAHNGEINTSRGNVNWMAARQASMKSDLFGEKLDYIWPITREGQSDTASFDNAIELLYQGGYSLQHASMMLASLSHDIVGIQAALSQQGLPSMCVAFKIWRTSRKRTKRWPLRSVRTCSLGPTSAMWTSALCRRSWRLSTPGHSRSLSRPAHLRWKRTSSPTSRPAFRRWSLRSVSSLASSP